MMELLSRWFIRDRDNVTDPRVRRAYGQLCGFVGIGLNILLFAGKFFAGTLSGSVAITADAFNNLSDAGSSVVTLLGFRLAGKKPDPQHPFGHGRLEYVSGLIVAGLILLMGVELAKSSVEKILHPAAVDFSVIALVILAVSICVKLYMCLYNRRIGKKIRSAAMEATAADSLSDTAATALVLISAGALAFIVLFNLGNINLTERVREIATIKVLGFHSGETGAYVFRENIILSMMGIVVGLPLGVLLHTFVLMQIRVDMVSFKAVIAPVSFLLTVVMVVLFTVITDLVMRKKIAKIDMAESLKSIE